MINWKNVKSISQRELLGRKYYHSDPLDCLRATAIDRFAFPGRYEMFLFTNDGGIICGECARTEYESLYHSTLTKCDDGWQVSCMGLVGQEIDPMDGSVYCDHCNRDLTEEVV